MSIFRHPDCPFECEIPSPFSVDSHNVTYNDGYSMTALDPEGSVNNARFTIWSSPTHDAILIDVEAVLDALSCGERDPEKLPELARAINLRPEDVRLVFAFEQPLVLQDALKCFHVASELCTPNGMKFHDLHARAFVGEGRIDFKFEASTALDVMKETWRNVLLSVRLTAAT